MSWLALCSGERVLAFCKLPVGDELGAVSTCYKRHLTDGGLSRDSRLFSSAQLDSPRQEDVECLIKLIITIGGQLDENRADASRQRMRIYFERITQLSRSPKLERRVQYALLVRSRSRCGGRLLWHPVSPPVALPVLWRSFRYHFDRRLLSATLLRLIIPDLIYIHLHISKL